MGKFDMDHMDYLWRVVDEDLNQIRVKEGTYKGSWKRRGGVGAFMMAARKWDRLENMAELFNYNIFALLAQEAPLQGADGTLLAEIRDLRRYLLLIEAEYLSCNPNSISAEMPTHPSCRSTIAPSVLDEGERMVPRTKGRPVLHTKDHSVTEDSRVRGGPVKQDPHVRGAGPADGRPSQTELDTAAIRAALDNRYDDGILASDVPVGHSLPLQYIRVPDSNVVVADRRLLRRDLVEHLPRLQLEMNHHEWNISPFYYRFMYEWDGAAQKHILKRDYIEDWGLLP